MEQHLPVIVLDDVTHCPDGCQVFIVALWVNVMEGLWRSRITVGACEVDGNLTQSREKIRMK